ncbi:uncharacterized protein LOC144714638 [Wolffia australiana]
MVFLGDFGGEERSQSSIVAQTVRSTVEESRVHVTVRSTVENQRQSTGCHVLDERGRRKEEKEEEEEEEKEEGRRKRKKRKERKKEKKERKREEPPPDRLHRRRPSPFTAQPPPQIYRRRRRPRPIRRRQRRLRTLPAISTPSPPPSVPSPSTVALLPFPSPSRVFHFLLPRCRGRSVARRSTVHLRHVISPSHCLRLRTSRISYPRLPLVPSILSHARRCTLRPCRFTFSCRRAVFLRPPDIRPSFLLTPHHPSSRFSRDLSPRITSLLHSQSRSPHPLTFFHPHGLTPLTLVPPHPQANPRPHRCTLTLHRYSVATPRPPLIQLHLDHLPTKHHRPLPPPHSTCGDPLRSVDVLNARFPDSTTAPASCVHRSDSSVNA